ncbi:MAG: hypothetical protein CMM61_15695 [Rhodospirillaceae bacterium]|nr:hypothetical protein [Rhodospirillaceae bacterium]
MPSRKQLFDRLNAVERVVTPPEELTFDERVERGLVHVGAPGDVAPDGYALIATHVPRPEVVS